MIKENIDEVICWRGCVKIAAWLAIGVLMAGDLRAEDNLKLPVQVQFDWVGSNGNYAISGNDRGFTPQPIRFQTNPPASLRRPPVGLSAPRYGEFTFGPKEHRRSFLVVVDEPEGKQAQLWVDLNGNGDLTDDPVPQWPLKKYPQPDGTIIDNYSGQIMLPFESSGQSLKACLRMYRNFAGVQYPLWYYRDYACTGHITLNGKRFNAALDDVLARGDFRGDPNRQYSSGVELCVDVDGNGQFGKRRERFDVVKPFNIGGTTYEIRELSADGRNFELVKSEQSVPPEPPSFEEGDTFPPFEKVALDGQKLRFPQDYKGKVVLIDFWATWCVPCVAELPNLAEAYHTFHGQGFEIVGVTLDKAGEQEKLLKFTKEKKIGWPQIYDGKGHESDLAKLVGVGGIPHVLLVDGDSREILAVTDQLREKALIQTLEKALKLKAARIQK